MFVMVFDFEFVKKNGLWNVKLFDIDIDWF